MAQPDGARFVCPSGAGQIAAGRARAKKAIFKKPPAVASAIGLRKCKRRHALFESSRCLYELKHDDVRALAYLAAGRCRLIFRRRNEMKRFSNLSSSIAKELRLPTQSWTAKPSLDGAGRPVFYNLMKRQCQAVSNAFDIIWLNGRDLRELSLLQRKKILCFGDPA